VIGRNGETIKAWSAQTGARVQLANKMECPVPSERVCSITGALPAVIETAELIVDKLASDPAISKVSSISASSTSTSIATAVLLLCYCRL
jgi:KH domain